MQVPCFSIHAYGIFSHNLPVYFKNIDRVTNSFDPNEMPSFSASHLYPSCLPIIYARYKAVTRLRLLRLYFLFEIVASILGFMLPLLSPVCRRVLHLLNCRLGTKRYFPVTPRGPQKHDPGQQVPVVPETQLAEKRNQTFLIKWGRKHIV